MAGGGGVNDRERVPAPDRWWVEVEAQLSRGRVRKTMSHAWGIPPQRPSTAPPLCTWREGGAQCEDDGHRAGEGRVGHTVMDNAELPLVQG